MSDCFAAGGSEIFPAEMGAAAAAGGGKKRYGW
jgi:hypothetical protein